MSLSRSPSPRPGGGWSSPGLTNPYATVSGRSSPTKTYGVNGGASSVTWESAKAKSNGVNGYPSFSTQGNGFFNRHIRSLSNSLPRFNLGADKSYAEKEKLGRGRWLPRDGGRIARVRSLVRKTSRKAKIRFLIVTAFIFLIILFYITRKPSLLLQVKSTADQNSFTLLVSQIKTPWRRQKVRHYTRSESRGWSYGVERAARMGN
jgi:mannan polymerase II complex MNN10 subunit